MLPVLPTPEEVVAYYREHGLGVSVGDTYHAGPTMPPRACAVGVVLLMRGVQPHRWGDGTKYFTTFDLAAKFPAEFSDNDPFLIAEGFDTSGLDDEEITDALASDSLFQWGRAVGRAARDAGLMS